MTPQEKARQQAEVMRAYANGAEIEFKTVSTNNEWANCSSEPSWNWRLTDYRVKKPSPKVVKLEAYRSSLGLLFHVTKDYPASQEWKRIPALDLEYVEE